MKRADVVRGLNETLASLDGNEHYPLDALREALRLLTPPTIEEIEAAREYTARQIGYLRGGNHPNIKDEVVETLDRALDALAREPGLEARIEELKSALLVWVNHDEAAHIAALEAESEKRGAAVAGLHEQLRRMNEANEAAAAKLDLARKKIVDIAKLHAEDGLLHLADEQTIRNLEKKLARVRAAVEHADCDCEGAQLYLSCQCARPDEPDTWCFPCTVLAALAAEPEGKEG